MIYDFSIYLIRSALCLSLFFIVYFALMRRMTFFKLNRFFLLVGLITSFIIPALQFSYNELISLPHYLVDAPQTNIDDIIPASTNQFAESESEIVSGQEITSILSISSENLTSEELPVFEPNQTTKQPTLTSVEAESASLVQETRISFPVWHLIFAIYAIGLIVFIARNINVFRRTKLLEKTGDISSYGKYRIVRNREIGTPFSFLQSIYICFDATMVQSADVVLCAHD